MAAPSTASLTEQIQQALNDKVLMEAWRSSGAALFFSQQNFEQGHDTACAASLRNHLLAALAPVLAAYEQPKLCRTCRHWLTRSDEPDGSCERLSLRPNTVLRVRPDFGCILHEER